MFKKWGTDMTNIKTDDNGGADHDVKTDNNVKNVKTENYEKDLVKDISEDIRNKTIYKKMNNEKINTILKGSKLTGDINVTCNLELSGDVEGNITSQQNSNIAIKGTCKGDIETREGNVDIEGELQNGNITAGNVNILGKFNGGEVKAKGKIYLNGEFHGKLEGNEIEVGSNAQGKGELLYKEYISISKGAKVEVQICRIQEELKVLKKSPEKKVLEMKPPINELSEVK